MEVKSTVEAVRSMTNAQLVAAVLALETRVAALEAKANAPKPEGVEMTDEHAFRVTYGNLADKKHREAAELLGLTYGQVYSCRLGFTFKDVHKKAKDEGKKNAWIK